MVLRLEELVQRIDADLCAHLMSVGIQFMQFAFKWMNCLLLREFSLPCVIRLWDTYISEGSNSLEDFHVYVCAAFLCQFSSQLQTMELDELFGFMQVTIGLCFMSLGSGALASQTLIRTCLGFFNFVSIYQLKIGETLR